MPEKFEGVDFSLIDVEFFDASTNVSAAGFRCNRPEFVTYWKKVWV
ncbi:MAG: hypothetical protein KDD65_15305 [Bacteroidetes bacterium]|nr:hypothetical protein [Bacteroidota bacterium]